LAFLKKLHNPLTNEAILGKVIQLGSINWPICQSCAEKEW
jgi:hypothetical protein